MFRTTLFFALGIGLASGLMQGATFVVNSLDDSSACNATTCTLRGAILQAGNHPGVNTITFSVSGTIAVTSSLPSIFSQSLTIDGSGQSVTITGAITAPQGLIAIDFSSGLTLQKLTVANFSTQNSLFQGLGSLTIIDSTLSGNTSNAGDVITTLGTLTIRNSTFSGNTASFSIISALFTTTITNSTFAGNIANYGVFRSGGTALIGNSTFAANQTPAVETIFGGTITMKNSIVSNNVAANCLAPVTDAGGNLSSDSTCPGINLDPKLGPLANNGGPTQTMALLSGSAAIDAAFDCKDPAGNTLPTDQRGIWRPQGAQCDIGAYEKSPIAYIGFYPPIANSATNSENAGRAIPITFGASGNLGLGIIAQGYPASEPINCQTGAPTGPLTPTSAPGNSGLSYDSFTKLYTIVWKTDKSWAGTCRQMILRLTDGVDHAARFSFR